MSTDMNRRDFLKIAGLSAAGGLSIFNGCSPKTGNEGMTFRSNPANSDNISLLGYGCMRWPKIKDENGNDVVDQETVNKLVDYALEHGINYFDTAPVYHQGKSEAITAAALKRHPRESYFIATKMSNQRSAKPTLEEGISMYENSLNTFETDHIDYYLLHNLSGKEAFDRRFIENGLMDFLLEERKKGRIRNLGFSFHGQQKGFDDLIDLHEKYHWDFVQIQLNYMDWTHASSRNTNAKYLLGELDKRNIPAIIMEPLLGGRLAKVPIHISDRLKERAPQKSVASWAFRFAGTHKNVLCVLSGMTYMEHLQDNIGTYSPLRPLTSEDMAFLEQTAEIMQNYPIIDCTDCRYCMPCPYGIDIPAIFKHYNKCVNEGFISTDKGSKEYRKARRAYLVGYDRSIPESAQADHCISCGQCLKECPQGIEIPEKILNISRYVEDLKKNKF